MFEQHKVKISEVQKRKLQKAVRGNSTAAVILRLKKNELDGDDVLLFTNNQLQRLNKAKLKNEVLQLKRVNIKSKQT